jgi:membrane protease YdiL (CAAX protease family)
MAELAHLSTVQQTIRMQIARHPMIAFIVLAYAFSAAWLLDFRLDLGAVNGFGIIGSTSPALAAMIVSALLRPEPSDVPVRKRWRLFGIIGILALATMAVLRLWRALGLVTVPGIVATTIPYPTLTDFLVDVLAAAVVALILSGVNSSRQGVRELLHSLDSRYHPVRWYWWVIAAGIYPIVFALGNAISAGIGIPVQSPTANGLWYWLVLDALITFPYFLFGGGGLEEPGWRSFALQMLQKRFSPLRSSLILAVIWAFWHWPYVSLGGPSVMVFILLQVFPLAILFTAVFNRTGGSLPIAILLHTSINVTDRFLPPSTFASCLWMLLMLCLGLWLWRSPRTFSPRTTNLHST